MFTIVKKKQLEKKQKEKEKEKTKEKKKNRKEEKTNFWPFECFFLIL
jgi:hypothetical protein